MAGRATGRFITKNRDLGRDIKDEISNSLKKRRAARRAARAEPEEGNRPPRQRDGEDKPRVGRQFQSHDDPESKSKNVPASEMGDGAPGPGVAGGKTQKQHRAERNRKTSTAQTNAATADIKRRAGNKAATAASFGKKLSFGAGIGATSKEDESERQATRKSIARQEKKTGKKIALTGTQASKIEHKAYKQIGSMLAEMFGLNEKALYTQGPQERAETTRRFNLKQSRLAKHKQFQAGKSEAQKDTENKERETGIVQSGKRL
jgi:hypothetical protein